MNKKLVLAALGTMLLCANAFAQDAKTVIANAQKALGNPKAVTYSGCTPEADRFDLLALS